MADIKFGISIAFTVLVIVFTGISLVMTTKPVGDQNQAMMGVVVATSIIASIAGWWIGYMLFKGNPQAQMTFLLFFVFILFASTLTTATASAFQLYGLREGLATKA